MHIYLLAGTTEPNNAYYLSIRAINVGLGAQDTTLKFQGPQGPVDVDVPAGQIVNKEIVFTTNIQPATVEIKGYDKATSKPIKINNMESVLVNPTPTKQLTEITISDQGKFFFQSFTPLELGIILFWVHLLYNEHSRVRA